MKLAFDWHQSLAADKLHCIEQIAVCLAKMFCLSFAVQNESKSNFNLVNDDYKYNWNLQIFWATINIELKTERRE